MKKSYIKNKLLFVLSAMFVVAGMMSMNVRAEGETGDFTVTGGTLGENYTWSEEEHVLTIESGKLTIANTNPDATADRIMITGNAVVTLDGVNIVTSTGAPIEADTNSSIQVEIKLKGTNYLESKCYGKAGVQWGKAGWTDDSDKSSLKITSADGNGQISGVLTAIGGDNAAGIGAGGSAQDVRNLEIAGGTITAKGDSSRCAGIGASNGSDSLGSTGGSVWNLKVSGGIVNATGRFGIGTAYLGAGGGSNDSVITGGQVTASYFKNAPTPTGGIVSTDGGTNYTVYGEQTLLESLEIKAGGKLIIDEGAHLTIPDGLSLVNNGTIINNGNLSGSLKNNGTIYNNGDIGNANITGNGQIYSNYVKVINGIGTGNYQPGETVSIKADKPADGKMFVMWIITSGKIDSFNYREAETTFTMPESCVEMEPMYADIKATITKEDGSVINYSSFGEIYWSNYPNSTLKLFDDYYNDIGGGTYPVGGVLDLNHHTMTLAYHLDVENVLTIHNGIIDTQSSYGDDFAVKNGAKLILENVELNNSFGNNTNIRIETGGILVNRGGLKIPEDAKIVNNGTIMTFCTDTANYPGEVKRIVHVYDKEVVSEEYLKSEATYTEKAIYYKSCVFCGQSSKGTEEEATFEHGERMKVPVTVKGSYAKVSGAGNYNAGDEITIDAGSREGYHFNGWVIDGKNDVEENKNRISFTVPVHPVTLTATWGEHIFNELANLKAATCVEEGYTGDKICQVCNEVIEKGTVIAKLPHNYKDGKCTVCGVKDPNYQAGKEEPDDKIETETEDKSENKIPKDEKTDSKGEKADLKDEKPDLKFDEKTNSSLEDEAVQTGDTSSILFWSALLFLSVVFIFKKEKFKA